MCVPPPHNPSHSPSPESEASELRGTTLNELWRKPPEERYYPKKLLIHKSFVCIILRTQWRWISGHAALRALSALPKKISSQWSKSIMLQGPQAEHLQSCKNTQMRNPMSEKFHCYGYKALPLFLRTPLQIGAWSQEQKTEFLLGSCEPRSEQVKRASPPLKY